MLHLIQLFCVISFIFASIVKGVEFDEVLVYRSRSGDELGKVRGSVMKTRLGREFRAFRGIPYAKPPINSLRFKDPIAFGPWKDTLDATESTPMCPQKSYNVSYSVSEDCLHLNVYTLMSPENRAHRQELLPVIVYIFPGAFISGSSTSEYHAGPEYLMDQDIVLVTFNHRLGALGFLATGTKHSPGNYGLKDQIVVLEWVRDYIQSFGGNPDSVTIFGYSSGSVSAIMHMVSPMAKGLFHRVIAMSGSDISPLTVPKYQLDLAKRQARIFDCPEDDIEDMVECLNEVDAMDLALSVKQLFDFAGDDPNRPFRPVIEEDFGQQRYLTEDPIMSFQLCDFEKVPVLAGVTKYEKLSHALAVTRSQVYSQQLNDNFTELAPICFGYDSGTEQSRNASKVLRETFVPGPIQNDNQTVVGLNLLYADGLVGFPMYRFSDLVLKCNCSAVYYYENIYRGRYSVTNYANGTFRPVHVDDLLYLMVMKASAPPYTPTDPESLTIDRMTGLWTQFAKTGNPNRIQPCDDDPNLSSVDWKQMSVERHEYLEIGDELVMKRFLNRERYELWDRLFPLKSLKDTV